ncbi:MAG: hypothetical protein GX100_10640 [candidate division WS1 bacterium]|jgi:hypothetical protein|nr:hypothetical protein [candidate division WS1 bacterium]
MARAWWLIAALVLMPSILAWGESARIVSLYDVRRAEVPPVIDGQLDEACWQGQPVITNMVLRGEKTRVPAQVQTQTTIVYDEQALYVGIFMEEPNPAGLRKNLTKVNGDLWWDDSVEVYLETGCTHERYVKLMSTPLGTRGSWQTKITPFGVRMSEWGAGAEWTVAPFIGEAFWSLEFRIPWTDLEVTPPEPGTLWTFEIVRFRYAEGGGKHEYSSWNVGAVYSRPASFGNMMFSGTTSQMEEMFVESLKPVYGGEMRILGRHGELRYTDYATLRDQKAQAAAEAVEELEKRLETIANQMATETLQNLRDKLERLSGQIVELGKAKPGAATAEALDRALKDCQDVEWTVRYHELVTSLPAVE